VAAAAVGSLVLTTPPTSMQAGETFQLGGTVRDMRGGLLLDRTIGWTSSNSRVATVTPAGLIAAVAPGTARITGTRRRQDRVGQHHRTGAGGRGDDRRHRPFERRA
jgi:hypothetical protein